MFNWVKFFTILFFFCCFKGESSFLTWTSINVFRTVGFLESEVCFYKPKVLLSCFLSLSVLITPFLVGSLWNYSAFLLYGCMYLLSLKLFYFSTWHDFTKTCLLVKATLSLPELTLLFLWLLFSQWVCFRESFVCKIKISELSSRSLDLDFIFGMKLDWGFLRELYPKDIIFCLTLEVSSLICSSPFLSLLRALLSGDSLVFPSDSEILSSSLWLFTKLWRWSTAYELYLFMSLAYFGRRSSVKVVDFRISFTFETVEEIIPLRPSEDESLPSRRLFLRVPKDICLFWLSASSNMNIRSLF